MIENRSEKAITALRWRWLKSDASGNIRNNTCSSDSYMVDVFRAVVEPGSRRLISPSANLDESIIDHVLAGGGVVGAKVTGLRPFLENVAELTFEIDLVLFADGEIAGPDPEKYTLELNFPEAGVGVCRQTDSPGRCLKAGMLHRSFRSHRRMPIFSIPDMEGIVGDFLLGSLLFRAFI